MTEPGQPGRINGVPHLALAAPRDLDEDHEPIPDRDSLARARDGGAADPFQSGDYATCATCGGPLYAESFLKQYTHSAPPAPGEALA